MERELKFLLERPHVPPMPHDFRVSPPEPTQHLLDEYLDDRGVIAAAGYRLRRRRSDAAGLVYTLKSTGPASDGALFERTEIEAAAEHDESIPAVVTAALSHAGVDVARVLERLQLSLRLRQERHPSTLFWREESLALLSVDEVRASAPALGSEHQWTELEIEFLPTVTAADRTLTAQSLNEWLSEQDGVSAAEETKPERAARLLGIAI